jgi:hypothetical protein
VEVGFYHVPGSCTDLCDRLRLISFTPRAEKKRVTSEIRELWLAFDLENDDGYRTLGVVFDAPLTSLTWALETTESGRHTTATVPLELQAKQMPRFHPWRRGIASRMRVSIGHKIYTYKLAEYSEALAEPGSPYSCSRHR